MISFYNCFPVAHWLLALSLKKCFPVRTSTITRPLWKQTTRWRELHRLLVRESIFGCGKSLRTAKAHARTGLPGLI